MPWARRSILAEPIGTYRFVEAKDGSSRSSWLGPDILPGTLCHRPFADLRVLSRTGPGLWIGYLSYELGRWVEDLRAHPNRDRHFPVIELGYCPGWFVHDTATAKWTMVGDPPAPPDLSTPAAEPGCAVGMPTSCTTPRQFEAAVEQVRRYITAGDVFQVNLAHRLTAESIGPFPLVQRSLFARLAGLSPAWYGAYLELADDGGPQRAIGSVSPELFLELDGSGKVTTRPIKGTRPASVDPKHLLASEKDAAELHMIVDLLRNDLGRVCDYGSVRVLEPRAIESHPTVHHGAATVTGTLHPSKDLISLLKATMPGGSVTGAPKIRAMQIINEMELAARGPYCGCLGWMTENTACMSIAIRTMLLEQLSDNAGRADFSVGSGIVADSEPAAEYRETLDKAQVFFQSLRGSSTSPVNETEASLTPSR